MSGCGSTTEPEPQTRIARIEIDPAAAVLPMPGDTASFRAIGRRADGSEVFIGVTWTTDDPAVASIGSRGVALGVTTGITIVRATAGSITGIATVAVDPDTVPPMLVTAAVDRTRVNVGQGPETVRFEAVFTDDRSGVRTALAHFDGPLGPGITGIVSLERVEESAAGVTFEGFLEVPAVVGVGSWTLSVLTARDAFGNTAQWGERALADLGLTVAFEAVAQGG